MGYGGVGCVVGCDGVGGVVGSGTCCAVGPILISVVGLADNRDPPPEFTEDGH